MNAQDFYVKDLRVLGRDLKNVIIVDNAPYSFAYHLDNGYPIIPYSNDNEDRELQVLEAYLDEIKDIEDIRVSLREKFDLNGICSLDIEQYVKYYYHKESGEDKEQDKIQQEVQNLQDSFKEFFKNYSNVKE